MADEEFEIDVYGDADNGQDHQAQEQGQGAEEEYGHHDDKGNVDTNGGGNHDDAAANEYNEASGDHGFDGHDDAGEQAAPAPQQGVKRKQEPDDRPTDPRATSALLISDMQWWNTEDEIRGWINAASCEDELKDITFSEHKVNGKSKGQVYVEFTSAQAATAAKRSIESLQSGGGDGSSNQARRATVAFHSAHNNPFKTLPKDAPQRQNRDSQGRAGSTGGTYSNGPPATNFQAGGGGGGGAGGSGGFQQGNFRGGRGGFNRGGMRGGFGQNYGNNMNPYNNNNNSMGGFNNMGGGGFGRGGMGGGFGRGGPNMRGRGGMNNMMGSVPPMMGGNMGMGGMIPGMNMMGGGMGGMGFNPMSAGQFNPGFFGGNQGGGNYGGNNQGGGGDWGNPHGAKRPRGE